MKHTKTLTYLFRGFLFVAVLLALACPASVFAEKENAMEKQMKSKKKFLTQEEKQRMVIEELQKRVDFYRNQTPPDYGNMALQYVTLMEFYPFTVHGKMAAWEAYDLFRKAKDYNGAMAQLSRIMDVYGYNQTIANPYDPEQPVLMRATARIEMGRFYAERGDFFTAAEIAQSVPNQYPGVVVGRFSGEATYYGKVEIVSAMDIARFNIKTADFNAAVLAMIELVRKYKDATIGDMHGKRSMESAAIEIVREAVRKMPASENKRMSVYQEVYDELKDRAAMAKVMFYQAQIYIDTFKETGNEKRIEEALSLYQTALERYPDAVEVYSKGSMLMAVEALRGIRSMYVDKLKNPKRGVMMLYEIERKYAKTHRPVAAYARYYAALTLGQNVTNYEQAIYDLEILKRDYPEVIVYPTKADQDPVPLSVHADKVIKEFRKKKL